MNSHFSNTSLDVWSKYKSFWTWHESLSQGFMKLIPHNDIRCEKLTPYCVSKTHLREKKGKKYLKFHTAFLSL